MSVRCPADRDGRGRAFAASDALASDERAVRMMGLALDEARQALAEGEVPVGAVLTRDDEVLARGAQPARTDRRSHGACRDTGVARGGAADGRLAVERVHAVRDAGAVRDVRGARYSTRVWRGSCSGHMMRSAGAVPAWYRLTEDPAFNAFVPSVGGVLERECTAVMDEFLRAHR